MSCLQLVLICAVIVAVCCSTQRVCVKGKLVCRDNDEQSKNVLIKLWDENSGPNFDDLMGRALGSTRSSVNGEFEVCGEAGDRTWNDIDPELKIYHDCQHEDTPCLRKTKFGLPDSVSDTGVVWTLDVYGVGIINLDKHGSDESTQCL